MTATTNNAAIELAKQLNGSEYGCSFSLEQLQFAEDNELVIVYGASDDLMEYFAMKNTSTMEVVLC